MSEIKELNLNQLLITQRKGKFLIEAQEHLQAVVKAVVVTGKKGQLVIKLDIEPQTDATVVINDDVTPKIPKAAKLGSSYFAGEDGSLTREDPTQGEFEIVKDPIEIAK